MTSDIGRDQAVLSTVARWVAGLSFEDIPPKAVEISKQLILDTVGVSIAATGDPVGEAVHRWSRDYAAPGDAPVLGGARRVACADAALANATLAHALDFDDHGFGGHGTSCILPAVVSAMRPGRFDGRELLTAYVAGMEVFGRLALATPVAHLHEYGFHPSGVLGIVAAAAAAGKAAGLDVAELAEAISIGASGGAGFTASFGTMVKPLHAGHTAAVGVRAADLARSGFFGSAEVFEARQGFGDAYTRGDIQWGIFRAALDGDFRLVVKPPSVKQWPCCGGNQRTIQNLSRLMSENNLSDTDIARVEIRVSPRQLTTLRYQWPSNAYEAKFCLPFTASVTVAKGQPTLAAFRDGYWNDPAVLAARDRLTVIPIEHPGDKHEVTVAAFTRDGGEFSKSEFIVHGSAGDPMSAAEISAKYFDSSSYGTIAPAAVRELHDATWQVDAGGTRFQDAWMTLAGSTAGSVV